MNQKVQTLPLSSDFKYDEGTQSGYTEQYEEDFMYEFCYLDEIEVFKQKNSKNPKLLILKYKLIRLFSVSQLMS